MNSKSYRLKLILMLFSVMFIMGIDRSSLGVAAPVMMKELNIDPGSMGIAFSAFFWTYTLLNLPAGNLADKLGSKLVLNVAAVIWSLASAATGVMHNVVGMMAARMGVGIGESAVFPVTTKIVADNFRSSERATVIGWYQAGARLGYAATPILMGFLIAQYSWRMAFIITGLGSLLWCVIWHYWYKESSQQVQVESKIVQPRVAIPWLQLLTNRCTLGLFLTKFCGDYLYYMFLTWVPSYLVMERGFSLFKMGIYASLPFLTAFIVQPMAGYLSDWLIKKGFSVTVARKGVLVAAQLCASSIMAVGFVDDPMVAVAILTLNIAAGSTIGGMMFTVASEVAPPGMTGTVTGSMNTVGAIAGILAPTITGFIVKFTGTFQLALAFSGCLLLLAVCTVLFIIPAVKPMEFKTE
ncbi:ACS family glucarate transporter-like MFS transporter [Sporomusaceae bacterium BoRhaA]|uniref:MFS transporter n=1 Tax=Pelorhabdus rhamnosifermentans TaxID=2772457 RepID=UPI0028A6D88B|nr:MFS transporter [Pelorhabdus rhamnosifermentans]MBU2703967.1 ACS family glucarate transporter-like MFS transporter [Pelorhabdus rhamnosifermentans]